MNNIVEGLGLILAAVALGCFIGYFKGWCCDGGIIRKERNEVEKKIRQQIRKMVMAEREAKRLAAIATDGTNEDPNEYIESIRKLLFPVRVPSPQPPPSENDHGESWMNIPPSPMPTGDNNDIIMLNISSLEMNGHDHAININPDYELDTYAYDSENDTPPSYEECMRNSKFYHFV